MPKTIKIYESGAEIVLPDGTPTFVGLDQSYSGFGVCALMGDAHVTQVFSLSGEGVERLIDAAAAVSFLLRDDGQRPASVALEGYAYGATKAAHMSGELGGVIKLTIARLGYNSLIVPPTTLKKFVTGKGNASKDTMILHVYKKWGVEFDDNNAADAYALARYAQAEYKPEV